MPLGFGPEPSSPDRFPDRIRGLGLDAEVGNLDQSRITGRGWNGRQTRHLRKRFRRRRFFRLLRRPDLS